MSDVQSAPRDETPKRALTVEELVYRIRVRLPGIRSTVKQLTENGELADYDDEMHNDLQYAVEYLEAIERLLKAAD